MCKLMRLRFNEATAFRERVNNTYTAFQPSMKLDDAGFDITAEKVELLQWPRHSAMDDRGVHVPSMRPRPIDIILFI